jgi:hypothetical protein
MRWVDGDTALTGLDLASYDGLALFLHHRRARIS